MKFVDLKRITNTIDQDYDDDLNDIINNNSSKTIRISHETYVKLREHSSKYHDQSISYDEIFQDLLDF